MTYPFIPIGLIAALFIYLLYILIIKKDKQKFKSIFYLGLFFIAIWAVIYYLLLN